MKANELRIGNWFYDQSLEKNDTIEELRNQGVFFVKSDGYIRYESLQPIHLTWEILEKAGFKERNTKYRKIYNKDNISIDVSQYGKTTFAYCYSRHGVIGIDYVHQLQNLYFSLTGEELNIDL